MGERRHPLHAGMMAAPGLVAVVLMGAPALAVGAWLGLLAVHLGGLVVGTDHAAEAVMGFFTKCGDGGFDLSPLGGLTKRRVRALAVALGGD